MPAPDNLIVPFQIEESHLRGRSVRLGKSLDEILSAHNYPYPVAHLVAETACLALLLSAMLKYEGIFTLQARGDGPVSMIVADVTSGGLGRATWDAERLAASREVLSALKTTEGSDNHLAQYLGKGHMVFTVDQLNEMQPYQGIVALEGASLVECVQHYFNQSEQIKTAMYLAAGLRDGKWRAGGLILQHMPEEGGHTIASNVDEDSWRRAMIYLQSATEGEVLDAELSAEDMLFRFFHEDGVRVYDPLSVQKGCRCDMARVENMVKQLPREDQEYLIKDDKIEVLCEFCSHTFTLDPKAL